MSGQAKLELVLEAIDRASGPLDRIERAIGRMERATGQSANRMTGLGQAGTRALNGIVTAATAAAAAMALVGKNVISSAADFETALTGIQKKAGTSAEATAAIGEEIKAIATSGDLAAPISDIAAAYERGAAAGIPVGELKEFASLSVKGADAFEMSAEAVGNFSAKLTTGLKMSKDEVREVFDLTNSLADAGIADESTIVDYMDRAGATMKTLGLAKEQTLALGATFLNIGMQSEVAATGSSALAGKLLTVGTLTGQGRKTFEKYMGSVKGFSKLVEKDANGALLKMLDTLKGLNKADRATFLKSFVGAEWTDEMLRLVEASDEYRRNLDLAADKSRWMGSLDKSYELKLDDFWSQWQVAKNDLEILSIDLGTMAMPMVKVGLEEARGIIQQIGASMEAFPDLIDKETLAEAQAAFGELKTSIETVLGIDTSKSQIAIFFEDLADAVNAVSETIVVVADALKTIKSLMPGQSEEQLNSPTRPADTELGLGPNGPKIIEGGLIDSVKDAMERTWDRVSGEAPRVNYDPAYPPTGYTAPPAAAAATAPAAAPAPLPRAEVADQLTDTAKAGWGKWDEGLAAIERYKQGVIDLKGLLATLKPLDVDPGFFQSPAENQIRNTITLLEQLAATQSQAAPQAVPAPDIVGPLQAEGAAATAAAQSIGSEIQTAASVTATPRVDTSSIDAATGKVNALGSAIRALPSTTVSGPAVSSARPTTATVPIDGARALGGPVRRNGLYLVGENGPELFSPGGNGFVHDAASSERMLGASAVGSSAAAPADNAVSPPAAPRSFGVIEGGRTSDGAGDQPRERDLFQAAGGGGGAGGTNGASGPFTVHAPLTVTNVQFATPSDKAEFEDLLQRHAKTLGEVMDGETRRRDRRRF